MNALSLENLCFAYDEGDIPRTIIENISLSVKQGEYIALTGANGSGKSTLARLICGFLQPLSGSVHIPNDIAVSAVLQHSFDAGSVPSGMVFQSPRDQLVANTVECDTAFGPQNLRLNAAEIRLRTEECLALAGLLEKAADKTVTLSSGQKQRLAFAGITALHPQILVLDEALSMIDAKTRTSLLEFIASYHRAGNTVIQVTHSREEISHVQRVVFLEKGRVAFDGATQDFWESKSARLFQVLPSVPPSIQKERHLSLAFEDVTFAYPAEPDKPAFLAVQNPLFADFNLELEGGTLVALVGKSGSGKSTLMEIACGLLEPRNGCVLCKKRPLLAVQESETALFEEFAADDVAFGLLSRGIEGAELKALIENAMTLMGLPFAEFADRHTFSLSGGEKRKLALAGIVALDADVYFFDEPTAGLDCVSAANILTVFADLVKKGKTVVFSTHHSEETVAVHRVITLEGGKIISDVAKFQQTETDCIDSDGKKESGDNENNAFSLSVQIPLEGVKIISLLAKNAFGSFRLQASFIHHLPAVVKYLFLLVFCCAGIVFNSISLLCPLIFTELLYAAAARYPFRRLVRNFFLILPWIALFFVFQVLFITAPVYDRILFSVGFFTVTSGKIFFAVLTVLHYLAVLIPLSVFMFSTDEGAILDGMRDLLFPLAATGIPVQYVVLVTGMLFRFVPLLAEEASLILKAQLIRNGGGARRGLFKNVLVMLPVFIPLILQTLKRAAALADALDARYYGKITKVKKISCFCKRTGSVDNK